MSPDADAIEPEPSDDAAPELRAGAAGPAELWVECWRCGQPFETVAAGAVCPHCRAVVRGEVTLPRSVAKADRRGWVAPPEPAEPDSLGRLVVFYALYLSTSVIYGVSSGFGTQVVDTDASLRDRLMILGALEAIDTAIVVAALVWVARPGWRWPSSGRVRVAAWLLAVPALAGVLWCNRAYHALVNQYIAFDLEGLDPDLMVESGLTLPVILTHCLQPAIVEELFFRYLCLGLLLRVMGTTSAVLISSIMFGMAHIGAPISIPILSFIGVFLAMARLGSGGLLLPMILHFLHNLAIVYWDGIS